MLKALCIGLAVAALGLTQVGCRQEVVPTEPEAKRTAEHAQPDYTINVEPVPEDAPGPRRIVSAAPSVTEICAALGLLPRLVGRTRYCQHPPEVAAIENFGGLTDANIEVLVALRPELIVISGTSRSHVDQFERLGLRYASIPDWRLEDLFIGIEQIGALTQTQQRAAVLIAAIRSDLETVRRENPVVAPKRVLMLTSVLSTPPAPPFVAGLESFYSDMITMLGHTNAVPDEKGFGQLSLEAIVELDPDVIIELDPDGTQRPNGDADAVVTWAKVGQLKAVRERQVHVLAGGQHYLLGPRIAQTAAALAAAIGDASAQEDPQ